MPVNPDLITEYWGYLEEMPAGEMDLDRTVIESVNGHLAARLRHILDVNGLQDRSDILLAVDASADFRAYSTPLASGYLIAHSVRFQLAAEAVGQALAATVPAESGGTVLPPLIAEDEAAGIIRDVLSAARHGEDVEVSGPSPGARGVFGRTIADFARDFVTCHELAHVALEHFGEDPSEPGRRISLASWSREMHADQHGFELFRRAHPLPLDQPQAYMGPALFLEMTEWIEGLGLAETLADESLATVVQRFRNHPPARNRLSALVGANHPQSVDADMPDIELVSRVMTAARGFPVRVPAPEVEAALRFAAEAISGKDLDRLFATTAGATAALAEVNVGPILDLVEGDRRRAEGAIARAAIAVTQTGRIRGALPRQHLGLLYNLYTGTYPDAVGDGSFDATLREAITDLDLIAIEQAALSWGQLTEQDS
jgi:hypothetical protein